MAKHTVKQGECIESIAFEKGFFWETIWNDPANTEVKRIREDPNVLLAGDQLFIPDMRVKEVSGQTEQRHRFRRKGTPSKFSITLEDENDQPRANLPYVLDIDGQLFSGKTDADGRLEHVIPPNARQGILRVGPEEDQEEYQLNLGSMDPVTEISGVQARLKNLGYDCGKIDGKLGPQTKEAISAFQAKHNLQVTGTPDDDTQLKLKEVHKS